ncbi:MAG: phosphodiester glycosidase family protein [Candidatus Eisenbacteria bacterium]
MGRTLHARWILPFVALVAAFALWQGTRVARWRDVGPGVEFTTIAGDPYCRYGSSAVAVLRCDPGRVKLRVRHWSRSGLDRPPTILGWHEATRALAVFNAGQYYPDLSYMGLLVSDGDTVSARRHPGFQGALVGRVREGRPDARVVDLATTPLLRDEGWSQVAQSFMLFDRAGTVRVRKSNRIAQRTVVAEDARGRLLVLVSEGGYTIADFATLLRHSRLGLTHAMSMDGGLEAELVVASRAFTYASFGRWSGEGTSSAPGANTPLPAVITLEAP